jgi:hypothetical protein
MHAGVDHLTFCHPCLREHLMPQYRKPTVEEQVHGDTVWVAIRSRGADWSWLTPEEAVGIAHQWLERYGRAASAAEPIATGRPHAKDRTVA